MAKPGPAFQFQTPASSANLGPGFGVLAVALDLPLRVTAEPRLDGALAIVRHDDPEAAAHDPRHDDVLRGLRSGLELLAVPPGKGLTVTIEGTVPRGTGLGTISAGFAAGLGVAARMALANKRREPIDTAAMLDALVALGGDPAHGGASLLGGLIASIQTSQPQEEVRRHRLLGFPVHERWQFVVVLPDAVMGTADTKRVLPPTLPHAVTPRTVGRSIGILNALRTADEALLGACLFDEVHVPYRRRLVPGMEAALKAGREAGAAGTTISGHGPGLLAMTTDAGRTMAIARAMTGSFDAEGQRATALVLRAANYGALPRAEG